LDGTLSKTPFSFAVSVLDSNGELTPLKTDVTNSDTDADAGKIYYEAQDIGKYVRLVGDSKEKAVFFLIKENEVSSEFTKDESYIIAKVTGLDNKEHTYQYYRVAASDTADIDGNPELITTYNKNPLSNDDAAFYNKSHSLIVKKKWTKNGEPISPDFQTPIYVKVYRSATEDANQAEVLRWNSVKGKSGEYKASDSGTIEVLPIFRDPDWQIKLLTDASVQDYYYFVQEYVKDPSTGEYVEKNSLVIYSSSYGNKTSENWKDVYSIDNSDDGQVFTLTVTNEVGDNVLPTTGGIGDIPYMAAGAGTAVVGLLGTGLYYRKKKDDDQEEE
jgi:LPXTG-motif cell wall-anchored protein